MRKAQKKKSCHKITEIYIGNSPFGEYFEAMNYVRTINCVGSYNQIY